MVAAGIAAVALRDPKNDTVPWGIQPADIGNVGIPGFATHSPMNVDWSVAGES